MSQALEIALQHLLSPAGMTEHDLYNVLDNLGSRSIDSGDLYFQQSQQESWVLEDGIVKDGAFNIDQGVGIRAISGEKTGFAYADEIALPALMQASANARAIARAGQNAQVKAWDRRGEMQLYQPVNPIGEMDAEQKLSFLRRADTAARAADPRVKQVIASMSGSFDVVMIAALDGTLAGDIRPLIRMNVTVIVEEGDKRETASHGGGGRLSYKEFLAGDKAEEIACEAVRQALVNLDARPAPAGVMPVVLGPGWPGVLLHEAVGHGLEGDFNRKGTSAFAGLMGESVASSLCTIVDDGTLNLRRGSLNIDDEGVETQCTTLIENGILTGYMQDKMNAGLMGQKSTGNGRRESYAHLPMPRMTNTYMLAGESDPAEIISSVDKGIYAVNFGGGQVDITSGKFVFSASEAYMIENGKITYPVKGATLIGNGPEAMKQISMVGNDLEIDPGIGVCGKEGQGVPVGVGQPTLKVEQLTVGGTQA